MRNVIIVIMLTVGLTISSLANPEVKNMLANEGKFVSENELVNIPLISSSKAIYNKGTLVLDYSRKMGTTSNYSERITGPMYKNQRHFREAIPVIKVRDLQFVLLTMI